MNNSINYGNATLSPQAIKAIEQLQQNNNENLLDHINALSMVVTRIGLQLDGFNPENPEDMAAIRSIVAISNTVALLQLFESK